MWNAALKPTLRLTDEGVARLSEITEGFSFAYLKELFLSSMMRWMAKAQQGSMQEVMTEQVSVLRDQMLSSAQAANEPGDDGQQAMLQQLGRMMPRRIIF